MDLNPDQRLDSIITGGVALDKVIMSEWLQLILMRMASRKETHLNVDLSYGGGMYSLHHCIEKINPPAETELLIGERQ